MRGPLRTCSSHATANQSAVPKQQSIHGTHQSRDAPLNESTHQEPHTGHSKKGGNVYVLSLAAGMFAVQKSMTKVLIVLTWDASLALAGAIMTADTYLSECHQPAAHG